MPIWNFRMGDVLDADDPLSRWVCVVAIAFNDAIHANLKVEAAEDGWEFFYEWRVAVSHFNEACQHLERGRTRDEVWRFIQEEGLTSGYEDVMKRYGDLRPLTNRVRNQAAFHYPYKREEQAVGRALRELAEHRGAFGSTTGTVRDSHQWIADDVVSWLVWDAAGGNKKAYEEAQGALGEAVAAFARFANAALDAFLLRHLSAGRGAVRGRVVAAGGGRNVSGAELDPG